MFKAKEKFPEFSGYNDVYKTIGAIKKPLWEQYFTTECGTSAEAEKYAEGFLKVYEHINLQEPARLAQLTQM